MLITVVMILLRKMLGSAKKRFENLNFVWDICVFYFRILKYIENEE